MAAIERWTSSVSAGRLGPNARKTSCRSGPAVASAARERKSRAPAVVYGGSVKTVSAQPRSSSGSGSRRSWRTQRVVNPVAPRCRCATESTRPSTSTTTSSRMEVAASAIAADMRSSSPSSSTRRPSRAPDSCMRSTRRSFVSTVQCTWSSSTRGDGAVLDSAARERTAVPKLSGRTISRPAQVGQVAWWWATVPNSARPRGVSCTGRCALTTPRLRSSPQIALTIGTGSSVARLILRTATGSRRATTRRTSRTPPSPSASPTAAATSATTVIRAARSESPCAPRQGLRRSASSQGRRRPARRRAGRRSRAGPRARCGC